MASIGLILRTMVLDVVIEYSLTEELYMLCSSPWDSLLLLQYSDLIPPSNAWMVEDPSP